MSNNKLEVHDVIDSFFFECNDLSDIAEAFGILVDKGLFDENKLDDLREHAIVIYYTIEDLRLLLKEEQSNYLKIRN